MEIFLEPKQNEKKNKFKKQKMKGQRPITFQEFFQTAAQQNIHGENNEGVEGNVEPKQKYTHVQFYPYKELVLTKEQAQPFYQKYCFDTQHLQDIDNEATIFPNMGEVYEGIVPVVVRIKLKFDGEFDTINSEEFLMGLARESQFCIERLFELAPQREEFNNIQPELIACLLEGWHYFLGEDKETVSKARIQFPMCRVSHELILTKFFPMLLERVREKELLNLLPEEFKNSLNIGWNEILDINEMQAPLPLYYSVQNHTDSAMFLTHIYPKLPEKLEEHEDVDDMHINVCFDPSEHQHFEGHYKETTHGKLINYFPLFFSTHYGNWETPSIPENEMIPKTPMPANNDAQAKGIWERGKCLQISRVMLDFLKTDLEVIHNYKEVIGRAIYGADIMDHSRPTREGEALFLEIKELVQGDNFKMRKSRVEYKDMRIQPVSYTHKTLCYLVKKFMKEAYIKWHKNWYTNALIYAQTNVKESIRLAEMIYRVFFLEFIVSEYKKGTWYQFDGNTWKENDGCVIIRTKIIEEIRPIIEERRLAYVRERDKENDDRRKQNLSLDIEAVDKLMLKLGEDKGISNIVSLLKTMFYTEHFNKNKNINIYVTGVRNGVMEAKEDVLFYRMGLPEDYITKQCKAFYEKMSADHPHRKFLMEWFRQMWPEACVRWYLKYKASNFIGKNLDKIFLLISGSVDNGKSLLNNLNAELFDEYYVDMDSVAFSKRKQSASAPTEEWEDARDTRELHINEPGEDFLSDLLKKIAGNDKMRSRGLHQKGGLMKSTFKITSSMNKLIGLEADKAIKRRARILESKVRYVEEKDLPKTEEEQKRKRVFKMDKTMDDRIPSYVNAYLSILVEHYALYRKEGLEMPKEMQTYTANYWRKYDFVGNFINEFVEKKDLQGNDLPETSTLSVETLYKDFEIWFKANNPSRQTPNGDKFQYLLGQNLQMNEDQTYCIGVRNKKMTAGSHTGGTNNDLSGLEALMKF